MKLKICQLARKRLSPPAVIVSALILAVLMISAEVDQSTCLIVLVFLICWAGPQQSCRQTQRDET